jgi:hypothetical protein
MCCRRNQPVVDARGYGVDALLPVVILSMNLGCCRSGCCCCWLSVLPSGAKYGADMAEVPGLLQLAKELRLQVRQLPGWLG